MWYINELMMLRHLENWHGVDQVTLPFPPPRSEANPNYLAMVDRFEQRFGGASRTP